MTGSTRPTDAELRILQVLWEQGPCTVREVHDRLGDDGRGYTTVLKLMQIMTEKGLVDRDESQRSHVYRAKIPRSRTQIGLVRDLIDRAFGGSASELVVRALATRRASSEELQAIRAFLDDLEHGRKKDTP